MLPRAQLALLILTACFFTLSNGSGQAAAPTHPSPAGTPGNDCSLEPQKSDQAVLGYDSTTVGDGKVVIRLKALCRGGNFSGGWISVQAHFGSEIDTVEVYSGPLDRGHWEYLVALPQQNRHSAVGLQLYEVPSKIKVIHIPECCPSGTGGGGGHGFWKPVNAPPP